MSDLHDASIDVIARTPVTLRSLTSGLPDAIAERAGVEGWSARDVVAHLAAIQPWALVERVRLLVEEDNPVVPNMDEEEVLNASGYRSRPIGELLDEFEHARVEAVVGLRRLKAEDLARTGRHSVAGEVTVADIVHHIAFHDLLHIGQVARLISEPFEEWRGAMRMFV